MKVSFPSVRGYQLVGRLEQPAFGTRAYALFAHCFTCSKDLKAVGHISRALAERGIAVLRFDFTGLGESEGDFADTDFSSSLEDLVAAADYLRKEYEAPRILIGHSLGGAAVLAMANQVPEAVAVATIGAPSDTEHLSRTLLRQAPELATDREVDDGGEVEVQLAGRPFRIRRGLLDDLEEHRLHPAIRSLGRALMVFHSPVDDTVGIEHAGRIYQAARHPKSFVSLDTADHLLLSDHRDARYVGKVLAAWADRYLDPIDEAEIESVVVRGGAQGFTNRVQAGRHHLLADEPKQVGGQDLGPGPYEYLVAGLGACTSMTLRMYADRKKWPLEAVRVELSHGKVHAKDCEDCESEKGRIDIIERRLHLEGPLDDDQRQRLLEIADRCPVHRTLTSETVIRTVLV